MKKMRIIGKIMLAGVLLLVLIAGCIPSKEYFLLDVLVNEEDGGSVHIDPQQEEYLAGTEVELTAVPVTGWYFNEWQGDIEGTEKVIQVTMDGDKEITAEFMRMEYNLTINKIGEGEVEWEIIASAQGEHPFETIIELEAIPAAGWYFNEWQGDAEGTEKVIQITMDGDKEITAEFLRLDYELIVNIVGEGIVLEEVIISSLSEYPYETVVSLEAVPGEKWSFGQWEGDLTGTNNPEELIMDGDKVVTAVFEAGIGSLITHDVNGVIFNMRLAPAAFFPFGASNEEVVVNRDFWVADTQVTYELWYEVRLWAENNGYTFENCGREGSDGEQGEEPSMRKNEPVTEVSWFDCIVWCNALSEFLGYEPVYRDNGIIIKDSTDHDLPEEIEDEGMNGFRLPVIKEWELAARYIGPDQPDVEPLKDEAIYMDDLYWTPGDYASGATANYDDEEATKLVAWYNENTNRTRDVGQLLANGLDLYDMSGNVFEWCYSGTKEFRNRRGGCWSLGKLALQVSASGSLAPDKTMNTYGFRPVRTDR